MMYRCLVCLESFKRRLDVKDPKKRMYCGWSCRKKASTRAACKRYSQNPKNKQKIACRRATEYLIRTGQLEVDLSKCSECGTSEVRIEKHYPDYNKPRIVVPLCKKCCQETS